MMTARPIRPDRRADERQQEHLRAELHDAVDFVLDHWDDIDRQAKEMGRGFPSAALGGRGGSESSSVEAAVIAHLDDHRDDPAERAVELQAQRAEAIAALRVLVRSTRALLPDVERAEAMRGRVNVVEVCKWCDEPAPTVKRLDGEPYHPGSCWWAAYNASRGRRPAESELRVVEAEPSCSACGGAGGRVDNDGDWIVCPFCVQPDETAGH